MLILTIITAALIIIFTISVIYFFNRCPSLPSLNFSQKQDLVSIIVPARNEEKNIKKCVSSLLEQSYKNFEVVVIDDGSTDKTAEIIEKLAAKETRLKPIKGRSLPEGWKGKPNAIDHSLDFANGDWLLFVDADVHLHPDALSAACTTAQEYEASFVTAWPFQETVSFWERAVQPTIVAMNIALSTLQRTYDLDFPEALSAWGPFILVKRSDYVAVGGHAKISTEIAEDYMLYRNFRKAGYRAVMLQGNELIFVRMYDSLASLWEGWSKNLFPGLLRNYGLVVMAVTGIFFFTISPYVLWFYWMLVALFTGQILGLLLSTALVLMLAFSSYKMRRHFGLKNPFWAVNPLGGLIYMGTLINSTFAHTFGYGVSWKGRVYKS